MLQYKRPKKIKGARKKAREEMIERLSLAYPMYFEGKTEREVILLVGAFKGTGMADDQFPSFCISYEAKMEQKLTEGA